MMSAPSCSTSRRVSLIAVSALSFEQPTPTSLSGWPLISPPVQPSRGLLGFLGLAPAYSESAATTPARSWLSKDPNAPWQSERTPILMGVPAPPDVVAVDVDAGVDVAADAVDFVVLEAFEAPPQPAVTSPATPRRAASQHRFLCLPSFTASICAPPRDRLLLDLHPIVDPGSNPRAGRAWVDCRL